MTAWRSGPDPGVRWARGRRLAALVCAVRGHPWTGSPSAPGAVVLLCGRCRELVVAAFVDVDGVLGLERPSGVRTWLGDEVDARRALDLVCALAAGDGTAWHRLRAEATAAPGAAVDSLALLASVLASTRPDRPALWRLQDLGCQLEVTAIEEGLRATARAEATGGSA